jgi:hypothetical protein
MYIFYRQQKKINFRSKRLCGTASRPEELFVSESNRINALCQDEVGVTRVALILYYNTMIRIDNIGGVTRCSKIGHR